MDLQNYVYTQLAPEEFYNVEEKEESRLSIFGQSPISLNQKKISKSKKRILNTLDILISLFLVTPMVVGNWRGIYQLMDIYENYFPALEGFLWADFAHLVFALCQNVFHYLIIEKKYRNWFLQILNFIVVKCYTLIFACVSILQCRCGWMIMDQFCEVQLSETGSAIMEGSSTSMWLTVVCVLLLFALKGLNNVASPPFVIALDLEDEIFLFRIRYFSKTKTHLDVPLQSHSNKSLVLKGFNTKYYAFLTILDTLFSAVVVCPLVVGYWRSVWTLMDILVLPSDVLFSSVVSVAIGVSGHFLFSFFQRTLADNFHPDRNRILYYLVSRSYSVCFAFTCVNGWRGPWNFLDLHTKNSVVTTTMVGVVALVSIRALRNILAPPCVIVTDVVKGYFEVVTMFRISIGEKTSLYVLDCLFSVFVVGTLVVFVWRGAWILLDILLFPEDDILSAWCSLVIGYATVAMAFLLQPLMRCLCERLTGSPRLLVADFFVLFAFFGTVNVWRGIWNLLNIYFLPDNLELSCWITHWVCLIILILLGCSNSLLVRGVYIDAEEPAGKCVVFPCYYLRVIFQEDKLKKLHLPSLNVDNVKVQDKKEKPIEYNHHHLSVPSISINLTENHTPIS